MDVDDLSFVDLPGPLIPLLSYCIIKFNGNTGVISSVKNGGRENDIEEVTNLVLRAIEKPSCLILLVVSGESMLQI